MTPLAILKAIESLTEAEKETLAILADEKLSKDLMKRRQETFSEMKKGEILGEKELFRNL